VGGLINSEVGAIEHKVVATGPDLIQDLDDLIATQGEPFGSTSIYAQYRVFKLAKESGITVTLDGQGADELLAGYRGYPMQRIQSLLEERRLIGAISFANNWRQWPGRSSKEALMFLGAGMLPNGMRPLFKDLFVKPAKPAWLNTNVLTEAKVDLSHKLIMQSGPASTRRVVETLVNSLQHNGLPQLLRHGDRDSMRFSIESRVPFLTIPMAELLLSMPEQLLISPKGETKSVFRAAMRGIVPDQVLDRRDKVGFETPEKVWLIAMAPTLRNWLSEDINVPFINQAELIKEFDAIMADKKPFTWQVWRWVNFYRWVQLMGVKT
jgi:asparagine synthase (glutamine-hydrolysing)